MKQPEISVIIPYHNAEGTISRAARSIMEQTLGSRLETIWVNDGSTDGSVDALRRALECRRPEAPSVIELAHKRNRGSAAARLTGLQAASGKYIIFCDADDYVEPDAYESMAAKATESGADMVVCDYYTENGGEKKRWQGMRSPGKLTTDLLRGKAHGALWNKLVSRSLYDRIGPLWTEGTDMWEDIWVTSRLAFKATNIAYLPQPLYHYVRRPESYTGRFSDKSVTDMLHTTDMLASYFATTECEPAIDALKRRARAMALYYGSDRRRAMARTLWPETAFNWWRLNMGVPPHQRAVAYCAAHPSLHTLLKGLEFLRRLAGGR